MITPSPAAAGPRARTDGQWWRSAVTYQVYIRSFADADGDGLGDIEGLRSRLPYLADLGVDAIWVNPWFPSPQVDGGYDVADYRQIDPAFGTLEAARRLIDEAHDLGLRVLLDVVPNHTSDQHAWFVAALAAGPGSPERVRYHFRDGRGPGGNQPPNDWRSVFGGPAWHRVTEPDGTPGQWYLHLFAPEQPDLEWTNPDVRAEFRDVLRFWFDRGADGFRIDVAHGLIKHPDLPDLGLDHDVVFGTTHVADHPHWDRPEVHEVYREWRAVGEEYHPPRIFVAEAWVSTPERLAAYLRPDELHTAFDFDFVRSPWRAHDLRTTATASLAAHERVGAPVMWVLSNHDIVRHTTRYGRSQPGDGAGGVEIDPFRSGGGPSNAALGLRRARAALLLELALPGGVYLYQGEELGLPEVEDLPDDVLADPVWERSGRTERGRDGCRVPLPWATEGPSFGFGSARPWLPQPAEWAALSVQAQDGDPASTLSLYRKALGLRKSHPALGPAGRPGATGLTWIDAGRDVLAFTRDPGFACWLNTSEEAVALPPGRVLLASASLDEPELLPRDVAAWLAIDEAG